MSSDKRIDQRARIPRVSSVRDPRICQSVQQAALAVQFPFFWRLSRVFGDGEPCPLPLGSVGHNSFGLDAKEGADREGDTPGSAAR